MTLGKEETLVADGNPSLPAPVPRNNFCCLQTPGRNSSDGYEYGNHNAEISCILDNERKVEHIGIRICIKPLDISQRLLYLFD